MAAQRTSRSKMAHYRTHQKNGSAASTRAAETARECAEDAGERLPPDYRRAEPIVRQRPGAAVPSAFGIGIIVGVVLVLAVRRG